MATGQQMTSEIKRIEGTIDTVKVLTDQVVFHTGERIDQTSEGFDYDCYTLVLTVKLRIARVESTLVRPLAIMAQNSSYHTLRAYFHASPSFIAILGTIWGIIVGIYTVVKWIIKAIELAKALKLDDLLARHWTWFNETREKYRAWVSDLSEAIGWGVDGLLHLMHAVQGFSDVYAGISGKSFKWMEAEWLVKTGNVLGKISQYSHEITENPGRAIELIFQNEMQHSWGLASKWGTDLTRTIDNILDQSKDTFVGLAGVANELASIQEGIPEIIRQNIPVAIWDNLNKFSDVIEDEILPRIRIAEQQVQIANKLFAQHSDRMAGLADQLAHPGTNLLGIDDLPQWARNLEELAIDNVASRKFGEGVDQERYEMQGELDAFALIDEAAKAPIPSPVFMTIESPGRAALHGIVATPQETWFVGGYTSPF